MPYERQRQDIRRAGLNIPVITLCRLETGVVAHLQEVADKIQEDILNTTHLAVGLDETPWPILNSKDSNGYFWILCNQAGSYYRYETSRSGEVAMELIKNHSGSVIQFTSRYKDLSKIHSGGFFLQISFLLEENSISFSKSVSVPHSANCFCAVKE